MADVFDKMLWAYQAVLTQTAGGGGVISGELLSVGRTWILYGSIGPDNWAAGRTVEAYIANNTRQRVADLLFPSSVDNVRLPLIDGGNITALTVSKTITPTNAVLLANGDKLIIKVSTPIDTETVTIFIRALIDTEKMIMDVSNSGGTVTETVTDNKVIG